VSGIEPPIKFEGVGSGLHTQEIINALMAIERRPLHRLEAEKTVLEAQEQALSGLRTALQSLSLATEELRSPLLFQTVQTATSSDPSVVGATLTGTAPPGAYTVVVSQLATAAQRSFSFKSPTAETAITIEGHELKVRAGETLGELAAAINGDSELKLLAATSGTETLVLSERETGLQSGSYITVSGGTVLTEVTGSAYAGSNATYSINGKEGSSRSNVLTEAIAGVTLTLSGLTPTTGVTVTISPPEPDSKQVVEAVKNFISAYNTVLQTVDGELNTKPKPNLAAEAEYRKGSLFGDAELLGMEASLRQEIYTPIPGLPSTLSNLSQIGVSSGQPSGTAPPSQSAIEGRLSLEEGKLIEALRANPEGVHKLLFEFATRFGNLIEGYAGPAGTLSARIGGDEGQVRSLGTAATHLKETLELRQHQLEARFLAMETTVGRLKSQDAYVTAQLAKLGPGVLF